MVSSLFIAPPTYFLELQKIYEKHSRTSQNTRKKRRECRRCEGELLSCKDMDLSQLSSGELNKLYFSFGSVNKVLETFNSLKEIQYWLKNGWNIKGPTCRWPKPTPPPKPVLIQQPIIEEPKKPIKKLTPAEKWRRELYSTIPLPKRKGYHRDHIIPVSFCKVLGLTIPQINHIDNLRYMSETDNMNKFSYVTEEVVEHLKIMCVKWNINLPTPDIIKEHNKKQSIYAQYFLGDNHK